MIDESMVWIALAAAAAIGAIWAWRRIRAGTGRPGADNEQVSTQSAVGRSSLSGSMADFEAQTEAARRVAESAARKRAAEEDAERARQARIEEAAREEAEQEALRREWDAEVARRAAEDEQARLRDEQAEAARQAARAQAEAARLEAERQALRAAAATEAARVAAEDEARRRQFAAQAAQEAARAEAERLAAEAEAARQRAAQEALQSQQRAEAARLAAREQELRRREDDAERERLAALTESQARTPQAELAVPAGRAPKRARPASPQETLVMVADDSKVVRVKTSRLLAQHGYRVVLAEDGADAVRKLEVEPPHALITDVDMPGLDGFELTQRVRAHPATADILVVMITAADDRHAAHAASVGVSVLLGKPYPEEQLLTQLAGVHAALEAAA